MTPEQVSDLREAHVTCLRESRESLRRASLLLWAAAWGESESPATWKDVPAESLRYLRVEADAVVARDVASRYTVETATELWLLALVMRCELRVQLRHRPAYAAPMVATPADASGQEVWERWAQALHNG